MPTGYTAGILDGDIKNFREFATLCMRAFGATVHMRDENMDKPYEPRVPSNYHQDSMDKENARLTEVAALTDEEIIQKRKSELLEYKEYYLKAKEKAESNEVKLKSILADVVKWQPPTDDHTGIKDFMIQQIRETIKFDCDTKYYVGRLAVIENDLSNLNPAVIRSEIIANAETNLSYHQSEHEKEVKRCNDSNKWVEVLLKSLPDNQNTKA